MPLGFRMLRGELMGLLVRKDPYVGYMSSVGSFPFEIVVAYSLGCWWARSWCWICGPGLSGGIIFRLIVLCGVAIHSIHWDGCLLGYYLIGCWARPGCGCLCSCPLWFVGLHVGVAVEVFCRAVRLVFLDAYPTIFSLLTICNGVAIFHTLVIWHVIRKE